MITTELYGWYHLFFRSFFLCFFYFLSFFFIFVIFKSLSSSGLSIFAFSFFFSILSFSKFLIHTSPLISFSPPSSLLLLSPSFVFPFLSTSSYSLLFFSPLLSSPEVLFMVLSDHCESVKFTRVLIPLRFPSFSLSFPPSFFSIFISHSLLHFFYQNPILNFTPFLTLYSLLPLFLLPYKEKIGLLGVKRRWWERNKNKKGEKVMNNDKRRYIRKEDT